MKKVLLENAIESWASAIYYCNLLSQGLATLRNQKAFVSSLHNAVELFLKQMMIDQCDKSVIKKCISNDSLFRAFQQADDLNLFFYNLTPEEIDCFHSIPFSKIIECHIKKNVENKKLERPLKHLNRLRNNETHFAISSNNFLSEGDFCQIFNFMSDFYRILRERKYISSEYFGEIMDDDEDYRLVFLAEKPIESFSYENAFKQSEIVKKVALCINSLNNENYCHYGSPCSSSYEITYNLFKLSEKMETKYTFDEVWAATEMLLRYKLISFEEYKEEFDPIPTEDGLIVQPDQVYYKMKVNL